jgi:transcriptional regulator GlxA family with amidase domain
VTTAAPLSDVAVRFGFFDQAHLGRWCKRVYGLTPAELRDGR